MDKKTRAKQLLEEINAIQNGGLGSVKLDREVSRATSQALEKTFNKVIAKVNKISFELSKLPEDLDIKGIKKSLDSLTQEIGNQKVDTEKKVSQTNQLLSQSELNFYGIKTTLESVKNNLKQLEQISFKEIDALKKDIENDNDTEEIGNLQDQILSLKNSFADVKDSLNSVESQVQEYTTIDSKDKQTLRKSITDFEKSIETLRSDVFAKLSSIGGGSPHRKILVNGTEIATRYADINLKGSGVTYAAVNNNTTKQTDLTLTASGGGGADLTLMKYVHLQTGVTGTGTTGDPYVGWESYINASVAYDGWEFIDAYFEHSGTVTVKNDNISLRFGTSIIRCASAGTFTGSVGWRIGKTLSLNNAMVNIMMTGNPIFDGNSVVATNLYISDVNFSTLCGAFRGATTWSVKGTRQIGNKDRFTIHPNIGTPSTNGIFLSCPDDIGTTVDNSTTTCVFNFEISGCTGWGVKEGDSSTYTCFGNQYVGGALETCGIPYEDNANALGNSFLGTDMEDSSGAGIKLHGKEHYFNGNFASGTVLTIDGVGGHIFMNATVPYPTDTGTTGSQFINCLGLTEANWAATSTTGESVLRTRSGLFNSKRGTAIQTLQSNTGVAAGFELGSIGNRVGNFITDVNGTSLVDSGGLANYLPATVAAAAAINLLGKNVHMYGTAVIDSNTGIAGTLGVGRTIAQTLNALHVYSASVADGICLDGTGNQAIVLRTAGTIKGYAPAIASSNGAFFSNTLANDLLFRAELGGRIILGADNAGGNADAGLIVTTNDVALASSLGQVSTLSVGFRGIPQNSHSADYTLLITDAGKHQFHPSADTTARTFTIPANGSVAYPIGTALTFINQHSGGVITIAITTDTMRLAGAGTTGSRSLAADGVATAIKVTSTEWLISGTGLT